MATSQNMIAGIKYGRARKGWSQEDLAQHLSERTDRDWNRKMVSNLERGKVVVDVELLAVLAELQEIPVEFYLYGPSGNLAGASNTRGVSSVG